MKDNKTLNIKRNKNKKTNSETHEIVKSSKTKIHLLILTLQYLKLLFLTT